MEIRPARSEDLLRLLELIRAHAEFERGKATISTDALGLLLRHPDPPTRIWVADDGGAIGYAALTLDYALWSGCWFGHLDCLFVTSAFRGREAGAKLLRAVADAARALGASRLEWQTPDWNSDAEKFYLASGATGQRKQRFSLPL